MCTDFKDLNLATLRDKYVMPIVEMFVDVVAKHGVLTFMDGHSVYNKIFMANKGVHKMTFKFPRACLNPASAPDCASSIKW